MLDVPHGLVISLWLGLAWIVEAARKLLNLATGRHLLYRRGQFGYQIGQHPAHESKKNK